MGDSEYNQRMAIFFMNTHQHGWRLVISNAGNVYF
jgi:hypothetical protein